MNPYYPHHWQVQAERGLDRDQLRLVARIEAARDALRQQFEAGDIYSDPCCHFIQRGAEQVAEAIADAIIARTRR